MHSSCWAVAPSLLASLILAALPAFAAPVDADSTCYMRTASGKVINLSGSMCSTSPIKASSPSSPTRSRPSYNPSYNSDYNSDYNRGYKPRSSEYDTGVSTVTTTVRGGVTTTVYSAPERVSNPGPRSIYYPSTYNSGNYNSGNCSGSRQCTTSRGSSSTR
jgi:hypothetical protein